MKSLFKTNIQEKYLAVEVETLDVFHNFNLGLRVKTTVK